MCGPVNLAKHPEVVWRSMIPHILNFGTRCVTVHFHSSATLGYL